MKVSIMITCYNCEDCIDTAIESVVSQDMPFEWELLIGDDGSSDNTIKHLEIWKKKFSENTKIFIMNRDENEEKNGTRAAKNRANLLEHATGEYLIFLDGDDQFLGKEKIKRQVELLDSPGYEKYSCIAHNILANDVSENKKYPLTDTSLKTGIIDTKHYWMDLYFHTNTILFRRCCVEKMLDSRYRDYLNDNFITYIILQYGHIYYLPNIWAQYNLTGNGLWTGKKRTYGCFRNLILFDLEKDINPKFRYISFVRHLYDFRYIFKNYDTEDKERIKKLVSNLEEPLFHYTLLLYKFRDELTLAERIERLAIQIQVWTVFLIRRVSRINVYFKQFYGEKKK